MEWIVPSDVLDANDERLVINYREFKCWL